MFSYRELLAEFPPGREECLRNILRYRNWEIFLYRSSVWHHTLRVAAMVRDLSFMAKDIMFGFDWKMALAEAFVHDDTEMYDGDIPASEKDQWGDEQRSDHRRQELATVEVLAREFPKKFMGYDYRELLLHAVNKDCLESKVVGYLDKLDAYCECWHEALATNLSAVRGIVSYVYRLETFRRSGCWPTNKLNGYSGKEDGREHDEHCEQLKQLFERCSSPLLHIGLRKHHSLVSSDDYVHLNRLHTSESIEIDTELLFYNHWRNVVKGLGEEGISWLTTQVEFLPGADIQSRKFALVS